MPTSDTDTHHVAVRRARAGDADRVAELLSEALADKYRPAYGDRARRAIRAVMLAEIAAGTPGYMVADAGGRVVGAAHLTCADSPYVDWRGTLRSAIGRRGTWRADAVLAFLAHGPLSPGEGYVGEVAVDPAWRRRGVGDAVMSAVEEDARRRGCDFLSLWVTAENAAARALYEARGFRHVRTRRLPLGPRLFGARRLVLMHLSLARSPRRGGLDRAPA